MSIFREGRWERTGDEKRTREKPFQCRFIKGFTGLETSVVYPADDPPRSHLGPNLHHVCAPFCAGAQCAAYAGHNHDDAKTRLLRPNYASVFLVRGRAKIQGPETAWAYSRTATRPAIRQAFRSPAARNQGDPDQPGKGRDHARFSDRPAG